MGDQQGLGDIITNSVTHGLGALLALGGAAFLVAAASKESLPVLASCTVFGVTLVLVYLCSTLYHSLIRTPARHVLKVLDHSSIYLLIAGTYTPFTVVSLHGRAGWTLFGAVWGLAVAGVVFKSIAVERYQVLSAVVYISMGWLVVFATGPLIHAISLRGAAWLLAGGVCYTGGILFFALDSKSYFHGIWHVFVLLGSVFHYFAVLFYVVQRA